MGEGDGGFVVVEGAWILVKGSENKRRQRCNLPPLMCLALCCIQQFQTVEAPLDCTCHHLKSEKCVQCIIFLLRRSGLVKRCKIYEFISVFLPFMFYIIFF